MKLPEANIEEILDDFEFGNDFLDITSKMLPMEQNGYVRPH